VSDRRRLSSRQHPLVKRCRELAAGRADDAGMVLLDGEHLITDALAAGIRIEAALGTGDHLELLSRIENAGAEVFEGTPAVLDAASPVRATSGIVAVAAWAPADLGHAFGGGVWPAIGLVDVQEPGNVGAVIRSADAFGGAPVLALGRTAHPGGWKALRGAMGSSFRVPVSRGAAAEALRLATTRHIRIAATVPAGGTPLRLIDWSAPTLVLLGHEGIGLPPNLVDGADLRLTVPMRANVNSLNVAAAAAVILYEARRSQNGGAR
jgi:TrmH family RNA methyltransferase